MAPNRDRRKALAAIAEAAKNVSIDSKLAMDRGRHTCKHEIGVNNVVQALQEDQEDTSTDEDSRQSWDYPMHVIWVISSPSKPKKTNREHDGSNHCWWQSILGDRDSLVRLHKTVVTWFKQPHNDTTKELSTDKSKVWQSCDSTFETVSEGEDDGEGCKEEVQHAVHESDVQGDEEDDWFGE